MDDSIQSEIYRLAEEANCVRDVAKHSETGVTFWLFEDWGDVKQTNKICETYMKEHNLLDRPNSDYPYLDAITGGNWGFTDEYYKCDQCCKIYPWMDNRRYNYFRDNDDDLWCPECIKEYPETYINYLIEKGDPEDDQTINMFLSEEVLKKFGFEKLSGTTKYPGDTKYVDIIYDWDCLYIRPRK